MIVRWYHQYHPQETDLFIEISRPHSYVVMRICFVMILLQFFHEIRVQLCLANRIDPAWISLVLLQRETANWEDIAVYPPDYVQDIRDLQYDLAQQYVVMSLQDEDHPSYRVDLMPYPLYRRTRYGGYVNADIDSDLD